MTFYDLIEKDRVLRTEIANREKEIFIKVMEEFFKIDNSVSISKSNDALSNFINHYFLFKGTDKQIILEEIMIVYVELQYHIQKIMV